MAGTKKKPARKTIRRVGAADWKDVLGSETPVLVDVYAEWCGPCQDLAPKLAEVAAEWDGEVRFVKVDGEAEEKLARKLEVECYPTLILFKNAREVDRLEGAPDKRFLKKWLRETLA